MVGGWPSLSRLSSSSKFQRLQQQLSKLCAKHGRAACSAAAVLSVQVTVVHSVQRTAGELFWGRALSGRESGLRLCLGSVPIQGSLLWHIQFCFRLKGSPAPFLYRCFWHIAPPFLWFSASPHFLFFLLYLFLSPLLEPFSHSPRGLKKIHSRGRNGPHSSLSCLFGEKWWWRWWWFPISPSGVWRMEAKERRCQKLALAESHFS